MRGVRMDHPREAWLGYAGVPFGLAADRWFLDLAAGAS